MCGGALALLEDSLSRGCYLQCSELLALGGVLPNLKLELSHKEPKQQTDPGSCARVVYIAGDTLRHQPIGTGHMTVLQFRGPITFCVLQWCHPMLTRTLWRTSCSTRMIALYSDRKRIQARAHTELLHPVGRACASDSCVNSFIMVVYEKCYCRALCFD